MDSLSRVLFPLLNDPTIKKFEHLVAEILVKVLMTPLSIQVYVDLFNINRDVL